MAKTEEADAQERGGSIDDLPFESVDFPIGENGSRLKFLILDHT